MIDVVLFDRLNGGSTVYSSKFVEFDMESMTLALDKSMIKLQPYHRIACMEEVVE